MLVATAKKVFVVFEMFPPWPWLFGRITNGGLSSDGGELRARDLWCRPLDDNGVGDVAAAGRRD
jgi:hypothetical protein